MLQIIANAMLQLELLLRLTLSKTDVNFSTITNAVRNGDTYTPISCHRLPGYSIRHRTDFTSPFVAIALSSFVIRV